MAEIKEFHGPGHSNKADSPFLFNVPFLAGENPLNQADPTTEPTTENTRLVQFLALMLERKKILRPRGRSADGQRNRYEHARSKAIFEVPVGELTTEFFVAVQEQLSVLVGAPKMKEPAAPVAVPADASAVALAPAGASPDGPMRGEPSSLASFGEPSGTVPP
ncbi:conserved hypothetical protein [sediment metagenome]|uniref:Uncharacterized protein n=1 Tax=sediment metagenome TaxID=749907 RepID=D9PL01_9ZZZZ